MNYKLEEENNKLCVSGFSLIEVLIAMAIFTFIIGGVIMFSVNSIKANTRSQAMQEAMDNARFTMDDLAKKIRTSSNVGLTDNGKSLFFIDNKTLTKFCYKFENAQMSVAGFIYEGSTTQLTNLYNAVGGCDYWSAGSFHPVVGEGGISKVKIDGNFEVMTTDINHDDNPHRGFVRIVIDIFYNENGSPENSAEVHLQSGVSIADYEREDGFSLDATTPDH